MNESREKLALDRRSVILLLCLIAAGFSGNFLSLQLFSGFNYLFGSIATLLTVRLFGIRWGLVVAIIASSWTIVLFGHPYAMVWLCLEPVFVGYLLRRGTTKNIILYDAIYWPVLGAPLIWIFFQYVMHVPLLGTVAALLMYWVIGITNTLAASLMMSFIPRFPSLGSVNTFHTVPLHTMIFNLMMATVAIPAVIIMVIHGRDIDQRCLHDLLDGLEDSSRIAVYETRLRMQLRTANVTIREYARSQAGTIRETLRSSRVKPHHTITLVDEGNRIIASTDDTQRPMGVFNPCADCALTSTGNGNIKHCMPQPSSPLPLWQREHNSTYRLSAKLANDLPWTMVVEAPFADYQRALFREHIKSLLVVLVLNLLTLMTSLVVSRRVSTPLRRISLLTTDLPERLMREKICYWPSSMITEVDQLINNFKVMTCALNDKFQEITYVNESLERRVRERSKELIRANDELQKEIAGHQRTEKQLDLMMNELINQLRLLQTLIDAIPNPIFYKDATGLYQGCNRAFEECWGLSREEVVGKSVYDLFPLATADIFQKADQEIFAKRGTQVYETQLRYADGLDHTVIFCKATYDDTRGNLAGLVGTIIDISARKEVETERDRLMTELQQKNKELEEIIYVASHDLRSPLVNVQGFSRKLTKHCVEIDRIVTGLDMGDQEKERLQPILRESIPKSLGFIIGSIEKIDGLLNGLLRLSRLGRAAVCYETLDMQAVMSKIVSSMTYQLEAAGARLEVGHMDSCVADAVLLNQVFSNLLDNAIKYRSPDRQLVIRISSEQGTAGVRYVVEDNGIGILQEHRDRIWEIFHRITPNESQGEGLGLTIARRIVDRLGGSIALESEPGRGSRFCVTLPPPSVQH